VQIVRQRRGAAVAAARLLVQALEADRFQIARHAVVETPWRARILLKHLPQHHAHVAPEGRFAGQHQVEDGAQAVDVRSPVHSMSLAARLLGAHVTRRAENLPLGRHGHFAGIAQGQTEVEQVRLSRRVDHDVGRFHVAVDHALGVGVIQCVGEGGDQPGGLGWAEAP
jgi:hypothetical protein